ncbi:Hypothetical predicted protein [Podarcis lilfordi]|uniref:Uncharacterized protein n=1 Tax=Podarcis lilfordi TaxID=74358 RepID=A0AA35NZ56_9SAUR|nr:Hypothetical predicted protein [Podarcis lilfordi]
MGHPYKRQQLSLSPTVNLCVIVWYPQQEQFFTQALEARRRVQFESQLYISQHEDSLFFPAYLFPVPTCLPGQIRHRAM